MTDSAVIGRDAAVAMVRQSIETVPTVVQTHSPEIAIDGDTAEAIWAMQVRLVFENGHGMVGDDYYSETYVKRGDTSQIASGKLTRLLVEATQP